MDRQQRPLGPADQASAVPFRFSQDFTPLCPRLKVQVLHEDHLSHSAGCEPYQYQPYQ